MDDTPFVNDGADTSLRKAVSLLNKIEAKTGSTTITGPVTVNNEVEIKNGENAPIPVSDNNSSLTVDGTVELGATSLAALENISVTFPATQNVNVTNAGLNVSVTNLPATQPVSLATAPTTPVTGTFWQATQPVSLASAPITPVTDNGGSLTVDGTVTANVSGTVPVSGTFWQTTQPISGTVTANTGLTQPLTDTQLRATAVPVSGTVTANTGLTQPLTDTQLRAASVPISQATAANLNATVVGSGSFTAAQATASNLKAQAQLLDSAGSLLTYAATGTAGTPAVDVVSVQGVSSGVAIATQIRNNAGSLVTYAESGIYGNPSVDVISVQNPQGTSAAIATFTSTTASSSLVSASTTRKTLTVYNSGPGDLNISPTALCTTTNFQIRLGSNDYWECPAQQVTLAHTAVYSTSGTAYVTTVT